MADEPNQEVENQQEQNADTDEGQQEQEALTLTPKELQAKIDAETDRRTQKALETAKAKWQADQQKAIEEAKNQGAKLAKMSAQEKAQELEKQRQAELDKREAELNKRELTANVKSLLIEKKLPDDLTDSLVALGDADKIKSAVEILNKSIADEVNKRVNESLQTDPPKNGASALDASNDPFDKKLNMYKEKLKGGH